MKKRERRREGEGRKKGGSVTERESENVRAYRGKREERGGDRTMHRMILRSVLCAMCCVVVLVTTLSILIDDRILSPLRIVLIVFSSPHPRLSASCELVHASPQEDHWRHLIKVKRRGEEKR